VGNLLDVSLIGCTPKVERFTLFSEQIFLRHFSQIIPANEVFIFQGCWLYDVVFFSGTDLCKCAHSDHSL
jgi:hypothetical protein